MADAKTFLKPQKSSLSDSSESRNDDFMRVSAYVDKAVSQETEVKNSRAILAADFKRSLKLQSAGSFNFRGLQFVRASGQSNKTVCVKQRVAAQTVS